MFSTYNMDVGTFALCNTCGTHLERRHGRARAVVLFDAPTVLLTHQKTLHRHDPSVCGRETLSSTAIQ